MVRKRDGNSAAPEIQVPDLASAVAVEDLAVPETDFAAYDRTAAGSAHIWDDYDIGECIDHVDGMTIEESDHMLATRLYQNTAKVHFNQFTEGKGRFGRRLIYGGHVISLARALSFNGLANAPFVAAINGGAHVAPCFAGNTIFAWSKVVDKAALPGRSDVGALRVNLIATKDQPCAEYPYKDGDGKYDPAVILDLDYWLILPRN
jgi:2-methylfumaryl-CoA hydratase